jgi:hypothetical protein
MNAPRKSLHALTVAQRHQAGARHQVLQLCETYCTQHPGHGRQEAMRAFVAHFASLIGEIEFIRAEVPSLSVASLYRWQQRLDVGGPAALADAYGNRAGTGVVAQTPELRTWLLGVLYEHPHIAPGRMYEALLTTRADLAQQTSLRSLQRWLAGWKKDNAQLWAYVRNPDEWKSRFKAAFGNAAQAIIRLNQLWELDSTPADLQLTDGRHTVLSCIDVWSRRVKLLVSPTSKSAAICALLRRCLLDWGIPEICRTDNGQDYKSLRLTGAIRSLAIEQQFCVPFASEQKPFVERAFRTFSHGLLELLGGYSGHSVADAQEIRARKSFAQRLLTPGEVIEAKLTSTQLQKFCDDWTAAVYERNPHDGLGGLTPFERATSWTGEVRRLSQENERALDILLEETLIRQVGKKGIQLAGEFYVDPDLAPAIGQNVQVLLDPTDLGRIVVLDGAGKFVCIATNANLAGFNLAEKASVGKSRQSEVMRAGRNAMKDMAREHKTRNLAEDMLQARRDAAQNLVALPKRDFVEHTNEAIAGAADAAAALAGRAAPDRPAAPVVQFPLPEPEPERDEGDVLWDRFCALRDGAPTADEREWMRQFETTPLYRSRQLLAGMQRLRIV